MKNILRSTLLALSVLLAAGNMFGQASYSGFVGESPVTMVTNIYSDGVGNATYVYDKFDEPIRLDGKVVKKNLVLTEKDAKNLTRATLTFNNYDAKSAELKGIWKDAKTGKTLDIKLKKDFETDYGSDAEAEGEFIQGDALTDRYFKVVVKGERAVAVKVFEKKTDRLVQTIDVDTQQRGADGVSVDDYNFDGIKDFSLFESSFAGPNTSSLYYLYDSTKKQFFNSNWEGVSFEFDEKKKLVSSTNSCCGGTSITTATYRVVKNKLVLVSETCMQYDEKKGDLVKRPMKACQ